MTLMKTASVSACQAADTRRTKCASTLEKIQIIQMSLSLNILRNILKPFQEKRFQPPYSCHQNKEMSFIEMTPLLFCVEKDCVDWRTLTHLTIEADVLIGMY